MELTEEECRIKVLFLIIIQKMNFKVANQLFANSFQTLILTPLLQFLPYCSF